MSDERGLVAAEQHGCGAVIMHARKDQLDVLNRSVQALFGVDLLAGPRRVVGRDTVFMRTGPEVWLVTRPEAADSLALELKEQLGQQVSIVDISDGTTVLRATGAQLRQVSAKILPIDLHPQAFRDGDVVSTVAAHIGVTVARLPDSPSGEAVFEFFVSRSLGASFLDAFLAP